MQQKWGDRCGVTMLPLSLAFSDTHIHTHTDEIFMFDRKMDGSDRCTYDLFLLCVSVFVRDLQQECREGWSDSLAEEA